MNIAVLAVGSRGDVQPAIALGVGLQQRGHHVRIGSYAQFGGLVQAHGLEFTSIAGDIAALLQSPEGRAVLESRNPLPLLNMIRKHSSATAEQTWQDILQATETADALVSFGAFYYSADTIATLKHIPHLTVQLQPLLPTKAFPSPMLPALPLRIGPIDRSSHVLAEFLFWQPLRPLLNKARRDIGLPELPISPQLTRAIRVRQSALYAFSPLVVPRPAEWPAAAQISGYLFLENATYTAPAELDAFLAAGEAPVYIGFGSMNTRDPRRTGEIALQALQLAGRRGLLMRGWGGLNAEEVPATVQMIDEVPHDWLFPHMAAVVHHGGAGTTAAGLKAGVPSITVPFFADQPFWAARVAALGVGPAPIPRARLTADRLARAIEQATMPNITQQASIIGQQIRAEHGVERAVAAFEQVVNNRVTVGQTADRS